MFGDAYTSSDADFPATESPKSTRGESSPNSVLSESNLLRNDGLPNTLVMAGDEAPAVLAMRNNAQVIGLGLQKERHP